MGFSFFNISVHLSHPSVVGNSQNPFILSDNVALKKPAIKSFQNVFHYDKITVNQLHDGITQHFVEATEHPAEATFHFVEATKHPAEATFQFVEATEHPVEATNQFVKATKRNVGATNENVRTIQENVKATKRNVKGTKGKDKATNDTIAATHCTVLRNNTPIILSRLINLSINL